MPVKIGEVQAIYRYPVKSMRGEPLELAELGWHGLDGDRRLAFRRVDDRSGFPWLSASRLPELILYAPRWSDPSAREGLPTHVRTPEGKDLELFGRELAQEIGGRHGATVEMMHLNRGIFDEAALSLITSATVDELGTLAARPADVRRFRPNVLIRSVRQIPFEEDQWVNGAITFGDGADAAEVSITNRDERCSMVNFDPDTARTDAEVLKAIVRERNNRAGVYGTVTRRGSIATGQSIFFEPSPMHRTQ